MHGNDGWMELKWQWISDNLKLSYWSGCSHYPHSGFSQCSFSTWDKKVVALNTKRKEMQWLFSSEIVLLLRKFERTDTLVKGPNTTSTRKDASSNLKRQWQGCEWQGSEQPVNRKTQKNAQPKSELGAGEMAQQVDMLVTKPDDLSLMPRTHTTEGHNRLLQVVLWPPQTLCVGMSMHAHTNNNNIIIIIQW